MTASTFSARQRRALAAMGIPVWVRRGRGAAADEPDAPDAPGVGDRTAETGQPAHGASARQAHAAPAAAVTTGGAPANPTAQATPARRRTSVAAVPALRIELLCVHAGPVALIGTLESQADRRLARDVVLAGRDAWAGRLQDWRNGSTTVRFTWPQTAQVSADPDACRGAFAGFVRGVADRHRTALLLLAGTEPVALLAGAATLWQLGDSNGVRTLPIPAVPALRRDPSLKRRLWRSILNSRSRP